MAAGNWVARLSGIAVMLAVGGCGGGDVARGPAIEPQSDLERRAEARGNEGRLLDLAGLRPSTGAAGGEAFAGAVNRHLWQASLDTLAFLPIASTDPFTGVIATDWGAPDGVRGERFRVTAFVTDTALSPNSLRVAVFREVQGDGGAWTPASVAPETPRQMEDAILVRARQLRVAEAEAAAG